MYYNENICEAYSVVDIVNTFPRGDDMDNKLINEDVLLSQIGDTDFYNNDGFNDWDVTLLDGLEDYTSIEDDSEDISDLATFVAENSYLLSQEQYTAFNEMINSDKPVHEILIEILGGKPIEDKE